MADLRVGVHPRLLEAIDKVHAAMAALGWPMRLVQGVRTVDAQHELWRQGREIPGPQATAEQPLGRIVTNADGTMHRSNHQAKEDLYGYAVDSAFVDDPSTPIDETWSDRSPWSAYGACCRVVGLIWGGDWVTLKDRPHAELPGLPSSRGPSDGRE